MSKINSKNTLPEMILRRAAHRMGMRYRLHVRTLPGSPDLVLTRRKTAVFIHGCFWHRHKGCRKCSLPKSNIEFWKEKFNSNVLRDAANQKALEDLGWKVLIVWQCEITSEEKAVDFLKRNFDLNESTRGTI